MNHSALWALGSNMGDRAGHLQRALQQLDTHSDLEILAWSRIWVTEPIGGPSGQDPYYNMVFKTRHDRNDEAFLRALIEDLETRAGRERSVHWGPRTLDVDLLLTDDDICHSNALLVPHPRMHDRNFVMGPAAEIAADWIHPVIGLSLLEIASTLGDEGVIDYLAIEDWRCPQ